VSLGFANDLHDAVLESFQTDFGKGEASIMLAAYENEDDSERKRFKIRFVGVKNISIAANLSDIRDNVRAGNVNYFTTSDKGHFYMYLVNGLIAIEAKECEAHPDEA
jgi:hypothetical protein